MNIYVYDDNTVVAIVTFYFFQLNLVFVQKHIRNGIFNRKLPPIEENEEDVVIKQKNIFTVLLNGKDQLLVEDHTSPCGYKIPNFPDHPVDPVYFGSKGCDYLSLKFEVLFGLVISVGVGFCVVSTSIYDYMGVIGS